MKDNHGNKGSNQRHEFRTEKLLASVVAAIVGGGGIPAPTGLATEATLNDVKTAVEGMRDYEVRLVTDSDSPEVTWLEVRYWDAQSGSLGTPQYYLPGSSTPGSPILPISYIPTSTLLAEIKALLTTIDSDTGNLDAALTTLFGTLGRKAEGGSAPVVLSGEDLAAINAITTKLTADPATQTTLATLATDAKLELVRLLLVGIDVDTDAIKTSTAAIDTKLAAGSRTHNTINTAIAGSVAIGSIRGSVFNAGDEDGTWNGAVIPPGVSIPWGDVGNRDTYAAIAYDPTTPGTGTNFIIEHTT